VQRCEVYVPKQVSSTVHAFSVKHSSDSYRYVCTTRETAVRGTRGFRNGHCKSIEEERRGQYECKQIIQLERLLYMIMMYRSTLRVTSLDEDVFTIAKAFFYSSMLCFDFLPRPCSLPIPLELNPPNRPTSLISLSSFLT
jgi:hypothetical protein